MDEGYKLILLKRLLRHTSVDTKTKCWLWTGRVTDEKFGLITINKHTYYVHRIMAYVYHNTSLNKPFPMKYSDLHICDNKNCWNPKHLCMGNHTEMIDEVTCKNGHDLLEPKNRYSWDNHIECKQCLVDRYYASLP